MRRSRLGWLLVVAAPWSAFPCTAQAAVQARLGSPATDALHVMPFPGTPDAAPASPVIFNSLARSELRWVTVRGSRSGTHPGHLSLLPDGAGLAFTPARPFEAGEQVTVAAGLRSLAAGSALGAPGAGQIRFAFTVARPVAGSPSNPPVATQAVAKGPRQTFHSAPGLRPPAVRSTPDGDMRSGDIFLTPNHSFQRGPMILDGRGQLVWFDPVGQGSEASGKAYNLEVQRYHGRPVLTWWQGGAGEDVIMGPSYRIIHVLHAAGGYQSDPHEFQLTPQGTAWINATVPVQTSQGLVQDCVIQELDVRTGRLLWEWHALGHVPLSDSYKHPQSGQTESYFHLNSIQQLPDGNLLISARNTWAVYEISRSTGQVMWTLGGKHSSFRMDPGTRFAWQHDAHMYGDGELSLFDDAGLPQEERESSAEILKLDLRHMRASLIRRYDHVPPLLAGAAGSTQLLPNGNVFVGWGTPAQFSEYTPGGRQIFNGRFRLGQYSYRAYRFPWAGQPATPPAMAVVAQRGTRFTVYASWNGATQVSAWRVLAGPRQGRMHWLATRPRAGFETAVAVSSQSPYLAVEALDSRGQVLGTSARHRAPAHPGTVHSSRLLSPGVGATVARVQSQHFRSEPQLRPPLLSLTPDPDRRSGDFFIAPRPLRNERFQRGPMILDSQGALVWFDHLHGMASNFQVQHYRGRPVLTWWQGNLAKTNGEDVIMSPHYRVLRVLHPVGGYPADAHEFQITPQGTALIDVYITRSANLSSQGGPSNGTVPDCVIQEIDISTGRLLWEWHSLDHVPISATYSRVKGSSLDYFHLNSIQQLPNGNLLVSARNTWAVYEISRATGKVIWTLGGRYSSFHMGPGTRFEWQHDARLAHGRILSLFDDAALPQEERESSAKVLKVNTATMRVSLLRRYTHSRPLLAGATGGVQLLPNGDAVVDWGSASQFSEYSLTGRQIFNAAFPLGVFSYRAYRFPWQGYPDTRPSVAVAPRGRGRLTVYASWNGATQVSAWRVLAGPHRGGMHWLITRPRDGFETAMTVSTRAARVEVQALNSHGRVLGTSRSVGE